MITSPPIPCYEIIMILYYIISLKSSFSLSSVNFSTARLLYLTDSLFHGFPCDGLERVNRGIVMNCDVTMSILASRIAGTSWEWKVARAALILAPHWSPSGREQSAPFNKDGGRVLQLSSRVVALGLSNAARERRGNKVLSAGLNPWPTAPASQRKGFFSGSPQRNPCQFLMQHSVMAVKCGSSTTKSHFAL